MRGHSLGSRWRAGGVAVLAVLAVSGMRAWCDPGTGLTRAPVVFSGGHETDPRDRGRPVILIAAALGVPADVFRAAFTHVHPPPQGRAPRRKRRGRTRRR